MRSSTARGPSGPGLFLALLALAPAAAAAQAPTLRHTAPLLGESLVVTVEGASPGASLILLGSPAATSVQTPWGLLEIDRTQATLLAAGNADAAGAWTAQVALPADPALAESPLHLQAVVRLAASAQLSQALHLRVVGSRAYVAFRGGLAGGGQTLPGGLSIVSLVHDSLVASVDYGFLASPSTRRAEPVLHPSLSVGAIQASETQLVLFEPFFGTVRAVLPFESASRELHLDASGARLYVLDGVSSAGGAAARIQVLDLESGSTLAVLPLAGAVHTDLWTVDPARGLAYVACLPAADAQPAVERFDLVGGTSLGLLPVGLPTCRRIRQLELAFGRVVVGTDDDGFESPAGAIARIREDPGGPQVLVEPAVPQLRRIVPLTAPDSLCFWSVHPTGGGIFALWLERPAGAGAAMPLAVPAFSFPIDFADGPRGLWVLSTDGVGDTWRFSHCALPAASWTSWTSYFDMGRPTAIAVEDDARGERLCIATAGFYVPGFEVDPLLRLFDPVGGSFRQVAVGTQPESVRVVPVP